MEAKGQHRCKKEFWQWKQWGWNRRKHYFLQNVISLNRHCSKEVRVKHANWIFKQNESFLGPLISPITLTSMSGMWLLAEAQRNSQCHHQFPLKTWTTACEGCLWWYEHQRHITQTCGLKAGPALSHTSTQQLQKRFAVCFKGRAAIQHLL